MKARQIVPGRTYHITRRTVLGLHLTDTIGSRIVVALLRYALAFAVVQCGMRLLAFAFMGNHIHILVTDLLGKLSKFLHSFFQRSALAIKRHLAVDDGDGNLRDRPGSIWDARSKVIWLAEGDAPLFVDQLGYVITNDYKHNLGGCLLPGSISTVEELRKGKLVAEKPDGFFRNSRYLDQLEVEMGLPDGFPVDSASLCDSVETKVAQRREYLLASQMFPGGRAELIESGRAAPEKVVDGVSREPVPLWKSAFADSRSVEWSLRPLSDGKPPIRSTCPCRYAAMLQERRDFLEDHERSRRLFNAGHRNIRFPAGTNKMVRMHGAAAVRLGQRPGYPRRSQEIAKTG